MTPTLIAAFDPSLSCTGYAVLYSRTGVADHAELLDAGDIAPEVGTDAGLYERARCIRDQCQAVLNGMHRGLEALTALVIEMPMTTTAGFRGRRRSNATLPNYGFVCGAVALGLSLPKSVRVLTPTATDWTRGLPGTAGDEHKEKRVRYVEYLYQLPAGKLGPKTTAGNVADAVLLARWGLIKLEWEARKGAALG